MIGCNMMAKISEALTDAKGNTSVFGGINIIFAGDFSQLLPVSEQRLYGHNKKSDIARATKGRGQDILCGKLHWLSIDTVVILTKIMCQSGPENAPFVELLSRLRQGRCDASDYTLLNSRLMSNINIDLCRENFRHAPIIVTDNATKNALNVRAVKAFAESTGRALNWYYSKD
ncbi:hypothetical protein BKA93DRAFT_699156, partial [Sparassis latifolia]